MTAAQKAAWFNLAVVAATAVAVLTLYPWLGNRATAGFSTLALAALVGWFYRKRDGRAVSDERDSLIHRRANTVAYCALWVAFVGAAVSAPYFFGATVPVTAIQASVWVGFMILLGVQAIATLVLYGRTADGH